MTDPRPTILRAAAYLPVADLGRSLDHWERVLGFGREYVGGSPPEFAIVGRDGQPVMLRVVSDAAAITPSERQGGTWDVFFWVQGLEALHEELERAGADVVYGPVFQRAYGMWEFAVRDPDGHVAGFGESTGDAG